MLQKYLESDYELSILDKSRRGVFCKNLKKNLLFNLNFKLSTSFFFLFSNIKNIDMFFIHRFILVFWLFTGCLGKISNLKIHLRLGIHYHHFTILYIMKKRKFKYILSFLIDDYLSQQHWEGYKFIENNYIFYLKNLEVLTNYKLARGVYFHRIQQKFFLKIVFDKNLSDCFQIFLTTIKLHVI